MRDKGSAFASPFMRRVSRPAESDKRVAQKVYGISVLCCKKKVVEGCVVIKTSSHATFEHFGGPAEYYAPFRCTVSIRTNCVGFGLREGIYVAPLRQREREREREHKTRATELLFPAERGNERERERELRINYSANLCFWPRRGLTYEARFGREGGEAKSVSRAKLDRSL